LDELLPKELEQGIQRIDREHPNAACKEFREQTDEVSGLRLRGSESMHDGIDCVAWVDGIVLYFSQEDFVVFGEVVLVQRQYFWIGVGQDFGHVLFQTLTQDRSPAKSWFNDGN